MNALEQVSLAALENQAFALMSRLHVILRRQNGRIIDIEYMRIDPRYCRYVLSMASQLDNEDVQRLCAKLEQLYFGSNSLFERSADKSRALPQPAPTASAQASPDAASIRLSVNSEEKIDQTYIGRLR